MVERLWNCRVWCQHTTDSFMLSVLDESLSCLFSMDSRSSSPLPHNRHNLIEPGDMAWILKAIGDIVASGADREWHVICFDHKGSTLHMRTLVFAVRMSEFHLRSR